MIDAEAGVGSFAAHCEGYGMGLKPKFQVGDKVRPSAKWRESGLNPRNFAGQIATVSESTRWPYTVRIDGVVRWLFHGDELELAE